MEWYLCPEAPAARPSPPFHLLQRKAPSQPSLPCTWFSYFSRPCSGLCPMVPAISGSLGDSLAPSGGRQAAGGGTGVSRSTKSLHVSDVPSDLWNANLKIKLGIERAALKRTHRHVWDRRRMGSCPAARERRLALGDARGARWGRSWRGAQEGVELRAPMADPCRCRAETNTIS